MVRACQYGLDACRPVANYSGMGRLDFSQPVSINEVSVRAALRQLPLREPLWRTHPAACTEIAFQPMSDEQPRNPFRWALALIMVAVLAWGIFHAIGAYRFNHNPMRAVMVLACVAGYLGFWGAMLAARRARLARQSKER
jgi:hypothetical protein